MINKTRAAEILAGFKDARILVIGDLMLDRYVFGSVSRISPEAPVPVVRVESERTLPGGASNVALNIASLGGGSIVAGIIGDDPVGVQLVAALKEEGIRTNGVVASEMQSTIVKTRVIAERQQVVRVDREDAAGISSGALSSLRAAAAQLAGEASGLIIEDYGKGSVCQEVIDASLEVARKRGIPVGFDPKENHELALYGITLATPNYREACLASGQKEEPLVGDLLECKSLIEAARILRDRWQTELLMITLGSQGMYLVSRDEPAHVIPTRAREVFDVSGAGDTVIAVSVAALAAGATHNEAAALANYAAGVVVAKIGTATCCPEELLAVVGEEPE